MGDTQEPGRALDPDLRAVLIRAQHNELTEHHVYKRLAQREKNPENRRVLERIADDERRHYEFWGTYTQAAPEPSTFTVWKYVLIARLFGLTFAVRLMERGEEEAQTSYGRLEDRIPESKQIAAEESEHEDELTKMIDEERLRYAGSVVLGLSDALVELTGALAGLTLALQQGRLIAATGLVTGIAASLSMAASEYLSTRAEPDGSKSPVKSSLYTGVAYLITVLFLIWPFLVLGNPLVALPVTLACALVVILAFTYYISVAKDLPFGSRFGEMAGLSLAVAAVSFGIGYLVRILLGVEV